MHSVIWSRRRACAALIAIVVLLGAVAASAEAAPTRVHFFAADTSEAGTVSLIFFGAQGAPVVFYERVGDQRSRLGARTAPSDRTEMKAAVTWRCDRLVRAFEARSVLPDGTVATGSYSVRTPSCATRLQLVVPRRLAVGQRGRIRVVDRWSNGGVSLKLCTAPPRSKLSCDKLRLGHGVLSVTRRLRATVPGRWRAEVQIRGHSVRRSIAVGDRARAVSSPPVVLATGDSTMQGIDSFLADELGDDATVRGDVRPGTGLSNPSLSWLALAQGQTRRQRQATTVMSIGASEGHPMTDPNGTRHECCGADWVVEYSRRVRRMMRTYRRQGRGRVIWLTIPLLRSPKLVASLGVNYAIVRAAEGLDGVRVLRLDKLFSPNGFQEVINYRGRDIRVRESDGVHLTIAGAAIAAKVVAVAVRER